MTDSDFPSIDWERYPFAESPVRGASGLAIVVAMTILAGLALNSSIAAGVAAGFLLFTQTDFFLPSRYRLTETDLQRRRFGSYESMVPLSRIRRAARSRSLAHLFRTRVPTLRDLFTRTTILLPADSERADAVMTALRDRSPHLKNNQSDSASPTGSEQTAGSVSE